MSGAPHPSPLPARGEREPRVSEAGEPQGSPLPARGERVPSVSEAGEGHFVTMTAPQADALVAGLPPLAGVTADSRRVAPRVAFAAYPGTQRDGRLFIGDAVARGAAAVVWEARDFAWDSRWQAPQVGVADLKTNVGPIAAAVHGHPSRALWTIGVTGTNGKTSCAHWIADALAKCGGRRVAVVGTLGHGFIGALEPSSNTTPDACLLQEWLARWRDEGADGVAMEVSSHGLDQGRVNGVAFDVALFTNLTRDHLDYHATMAAYGEAKARLVAWPGLQAAVINAGDAFGRELIARARQRGQRVISYGADDADIAATDVDMTGSRMTIAIRSPQGRGTLSTALTGAFNVQNLLGVLGVLLASDVALADALAALATVTAPPGRMERLGGGRRSARRRRLRAHARRAGAGARRDAAGRSRRRPADLRVRLRRRSGPRQARADGRGCRPPRRSRDRHQRQSARRGSPRDRRRHSRRTRRARIRIDGRARPRARDRAGAWRCASG